MNLSRSPTRKLSGVSSILTVIVVLAVAVFNVQSHAQQTAAADSDQTYSLQRVFKTGDVDLYRMIINQLINGPVTGGQDYQIKMDIVIKDTTKSVDDGGLVTVVEEYPKAEGKFNGTDTDMIPMMPKITLKKDKAGQINVTAEGGQEPLIQQISDMAKILWQSHAAMLPAKPIKVGDTWSNDISDVGPDKDTTTKVTVKLEGITMLNGVKTLRLKTITDTTGSPQAATKLHGEGTAYVDAASGKPVKIISKAAGTEKGAKVSIDTLFEKAGPEDLKPAKKEAAPK